MSRRTSVSKEVRDEIVRRIKEEGIPVAQAAEEHGISNRTIYGWLTKGVVNQPPSITELARLKRQNQALLEIIGQLTVDLSTVKKRPHAV